MQSRACIVLKQNTYKERFFLQSVTNLNLFLKILLAAESNRPADSGSKVKKQNFLFLPNAFSEHAILDV